METADHRNSDPILAITRLFRPSLGKLEGLERTNSVVDVLGVLIALPLSLVGLAWLILRTDLGLIAHQWPVLLLLALLEFALSRLTFFAIVDLGGSSLYGNASGTLEGIVKWSGLFLFGPTFAWVDLILSTVQQIPPRQERRTADQRWRAGRNISVNVATSSFLQLVSLSVYQALGGSYPMAGLSLRWLLLGAAAIAAQFLLEAVMVWISYLGYFLWGTRRTLAPQLWVSLPALLFMGMVIPYLANLFAIPLAGVYAQNGLFFYLVFIMATLLVALLARQMSRAGEDSRQQSAQLEKLELMGRAILKSAPDASELPEILTKHAPAMFTTRRLEIWMGERLLLQSPPKWLSDDRPWRTWVETQLEARTFTVKEKLPWKDGQSIHPPLITAPILDDQTGQPIGGVYVELIRLAHPWDRKALQRQIPPLQGLAAQVASALHQAKIYKETLDHQKTQQELEIARQIQTSFLPHELPQIPDWQIAASLEPAREMAGDFYDLIPLPGGLLGILIADVADKGIGPALYMALSRTLIRTFATQYREHPEKVMQYANERILQDADYGLFVTTFYGVLDPQTGELIYANAGHNPPWVFEEDKIQPTLLPRTGMALGADESAAWTRAKVRLAAGSTVFFYTDGATDAQNQQEELFGEERLLQNVQANLTRPAAEMHASVVSGIRDFMGGTPQFDDITLIILKSEPGSQRRGRIRRTS